MKNWANEPNAMLNLAGVLAADDENSRSTQPLNYSYADSASAHKSTRYVACLDGCVEEHNKKAERRGGGVVDGN